MAKYLKVNAKKYNAWSNRIAKLYEEVDSILDDEPYSEPLDSNKELEQKLNDYRDEVNNLQQKLWNAQGTIEDLQIARDEVSKHLAKACAQIRVLKGDLKVTERLLKIATNPGCEHEPED